MLCLLTPGRVAWLLREGAGAARDAGGRSDPFAHPCDRPKPSKIEEKPSESASGAGLVGVADQAPGRDAIWLVSQLLSDWLEESAASSCENSCTRKFCLSVRADCIDVIWLPRFEIWELSPVMREAIVPPGSDALSARFTKLDDQLARIDFTPLALDDSMLASVVALSWRFPASAEEDTAPLPVVAPVLTPMSSMVAAPVGSPLPGVYIIERIDVSRS